MQVHVIKAENQKGYHQRAIRVAYYLRVSSKSGDQLQSLNTMMINAKEQAIANDWEVADIYIDAGITGTGKKKRPELQRLIQDCKAGNIDKVIIKSVSRLGRNVVELMETANVLREFGVTILFDTDGIDTGQRYDPIILSTKAMLEENESKSLSTNMLWSLKRRFQEGTYIQSNDPYGYYHDKNGLTYIDPYEGEIIKRIFREYLQGFGLNEIADHLNADHCISKKFALWNATTLTYILQNTTYMGETVWQKKYTVADAFPFHQVVNKGQMPQYVVGDIYEPLISREDFLKAQLIREYKSHSVKADVDKEKHGRRYLFSGMIKCGCGKTFRRKCNYGIVKWTCMQHLKDSKSCKVKAVKEEAIKNAFVCVRNKLCTNLNLIKDLHEDLTSYIKMY